MLRSRNQTTNQIARSYKNDGFDWPFNRNMKEQPLGCCNLRVFGCAEDAPPPPASGSQAVTHELLNINLKLSMTRNFVRYFLDCIAKIT